MPPSDISIVYCDGSREKDWNAYVEASPGATLGHHLAWKRVVEETYGHRPFYLMAYRGDRVVGVLPLFLIRSIFFGKYLVTSPFLTFGGMLSDHDEAASMLVAKAVEVAQEQNVNYIEVRNDRIYRQFSHSKNVYYTLVLDLSPGEETVWKSKLKPTARRNVRRALGAGLEVVEGQEQIGEFVRVNARNMHRLGTPAHDERFFRNIIRFFPQACLLMVRYRQEYVGGTLLVPFKDIVLMPWVGSLEQYFELRPNNLVYWAAIQWSIRKGFRIFDFGRSKWDSGTFRFKEQYGAEPVPLFYQYHLNKASKIPNVDPDAARYRFLVTLWRRLPAPGANLIGPVILKGIA